MPAHTKRPLVTFQRLIVVVGLLLILGVGSGVFFGLTAYQQHAGPIAVEPVLSTSTPHPPRGRRWFYDAPLLLPPEQAQP